MASPPSPIPNFSYVPNLPIHLYITLQCCLFITEYNHISCLLDLMSFHVKPLFFSFSVSMLVVVVMTHLHFTTLSKQQELSSMKPYVSLLLCTQPASLSVNQHTHRYYLLQHFTTHCIYIYVMFLWALLRRTMLKYSYLVCAPKFHR